MRALYLVFEPTELSAAGGGATSCSTKRGPNICLTPFSSLTLFVRVFFILLQSYFVSFTLLSARGSSAMGRFPRSPDLLILQFGQGFPFPQSVGGRSVVSTHRHCRTSCPELGVDTDLSVSFRPSCFQGC